MSDVSQEVIDEFFPEVPSVEELQEFIRIFEETHPKFSPPWGSYLSCVHPPEGYEQAHEFAVYTLDFVRHGEGEEETFDAIPAHWFSASRATEVVQEGHGDGSQVTRRAVQDLLNAIGVDNLLGATVELAYEQGLSISPPFQRGADRWTSSLEDGEDQPVLADDEVADDGAPDFDEDEDEDEESEDFVELKGEEASKGLVPSVLTMTRTTPAWRRVSLTRRGAVVAQTKFCYQSGCHSVSWVWSVLGCCSPPRPALRADLGVSSSAACEPVISFPACSRAGKRWQCQLDSQPFYNGWSVLSSSSPPGLVAEITTLF
jgi:hypothetical protein